MSIHIYTKCNDGKWFCFGTMFGYDHSFEGYTKDIAQNKMRELLDRKKVKDVIWHEPKIIEKSKSIKYRASLWDLRPKIDNL